MKQALLLSVAVTWLKLGYLNIWDQCRRQTVQPHIVGGYSFFGRDNGVLRHYLTQYFWLHYHEATFSVFYSWRALRTTEVDGAEVKLAESQKIDILSIRSVKH